MRKLLLAGFAALLAIGCTEKKTTEEPLNPYLPIRDLVIPTLAITGEDITLQGRGFMADCGMEFQLNGETEKTEAQVVSVDEQSLVLTVPVSLKLGFYALVLTQNGKSTKIGGLNVKGDTFNESDFELYAVAGNKKEIYPVSISMQVQGKSPLKNSSTSIFGYEGYAVGTPDGKVYYAAFDMGSGGKQIYDVGSYDSKTQTNQGAKRVDDFFAMGQIDGKFHILKTADRTTYTLVVWDNGTETVVRTFDFSPIGSQRILVLDSRFVYHAPTKTIVISGNMGSGDNVGQATVSLSLEAGTVTQNGGVSTMNYWAATTGTDLYCFAMKTNSDETYTTQVYHIENPQQWNVNGSGATLVATLTGMGFGCPIYSPVSGKIYGMNDFDASDIVVTFDPATNSFESRKWVNPQLNYLVYIPQIKSEN